MLSSAVLIFPIWTLIFYCKNFEKWTDDEWMDRYGAIFEGLNLREKSVLQRTHTLTHKKQMKINDEKRSAVAYAIIF